MGDGNTGMAGATAAVLAKSYDLSIDWASADARAAIKQCWLDWFGVALAGAGEPPAQLMTGEALDRGGVGDCTLVGRHERLGLFDAVLVNGAASHTLDYDDGNVPMSAHPSVVLVPGLLSLGEVLRASGKDIMDAFLAGYETGARIGLLVAPGHYALGFHGTATIGTFAAAAAASRLLRLSRSQAAVALGLAGTQAAGLQAAFGTMAKPLHAGRAALNGVHAARLVARGFGAPCDILEHPRGFAATHSDDFSIETALAEPPEGLHLFAGRFKFHAACQATHASIEAARDLCARGRPEPNSIARIAITVPPLIDQVCNIPRASTGLELKFSIRSVVALALLGYDTADPATFTDEMAGLPAMIRLAQRTSVQLREDRPYGVSDLAVELDDGSILTGRFEAAANELSLTEQGERLRSKFRALATPVLGPERARRLEAAILSLDGAQDVSEVVRLAALDDAPVSFDVARN